MRRYEDDGRPLMRCGHPGIQPFDRASFDIEAFNGALGRGQRIGAARGVFEVPHSIDAHNEEIAEQFLGKDETDNRE